MVATLISGYRSPYWQATQLYRAPMRDSTQYTWLRSLSRTTVVLWRQYTRHHYQHRKLRPDS